MEAKDQAEILAALALASTIPKIKKKGSNTTPKKKKRKKKNKKTHR